MTKDIHPSDIHPGLNCLSYWYPQIAGVGLPAPRTIFTKVPGDRMAGIMKAALDGETTEEWRALIGRLNELIANHDIQAPIFLRTGLTSGKHSWNRTCYVDDLTQIGQHVANLIEFSECAGILGLPYNIWVIREFLPGKVYCTCKSYGDMPVRKEFRVFATNGMVGCVHPYWPVQAIHRGEPDNPDWIDMLGDLYSLQPDDYSMIVDIAKRASAAVGGSWSIDILDTDKGWYLTDMARAVESFHWEGCPNASE